MLVFPQLSTGASTLYPLTKTSRQRTALNTLGDGSIVVYTDPDAASLGWELQLKGLTAAEWGSIETLFEATHGMWQTFTFLDPAGNLVADSENFDGPAWTNGALISLTTGANDPFGTTRATSVTNAGEGMEAIAQTLAVPGNFNYSLSAWASTTSGSSVTLVISTAGGSAIKTFTLGAQWTRISLAANLGQATDAVTFAVQLNTAASIQLFGVQVEAQLGPSDYKQTGSVSGLYPNARFGADTITVTTQGTDVFDAVIQIVNTEN